MVSGDITLINKTQRRDCGVIEKRQLSSSKDTPLSGNFSALVWNTNVWGVVSGTTADISLGVKSEHKGQCVEQNRTEP